MPQDATGVERISSTTNPKLVIDRYLQQARLSLMDSNTIISASARTGRTARGCHLHDCGFAFSCWRAKKDKAEFQAGIGRAGFATARHSCAAWLWTAQGEDEPSSRVLTFTSGSLSDVECAARWTNATRGRGSARRYGTVPNVIPGGKVRPSASWRYPAVLYAPRPRGVRATYRRYA